MNSALLIQDLFFSYAKDFLLLEKVSLSIPMGTFAAIIGPNGGGKTTLLKLILGLLKPQKGTILIHSLPPQEIRSKIGYVPQMSQTDRDFPISVYELVLLGALSRLSWKGRYPSEVKEKALHLLEQMGLIDYRYRPFGSLSGGQAQKALIARALIGDPFLLLLDEPTSHIDRESEQAIFELLLQLKGKKTILMVSHNFKSLIQEVEMLFCVQQQVTSLQPHEICSHFSLGLFHTPQDHKL